MKTCRICLLEKELTEFDLEPRMRDGRRNQCRSCRVESKTRRAHSRRPELEASAAALELTGSPKVCNRCRSTLPFSAFNRCRARPDGRQNYCRECSRTAVMSNYREKIEERRAYFREYKKTEQAKENARKYLLTRLQRKLSHYLRCRITSAIKAQRARGARPSQKAGSAVGDLGCTPLELIAHLERKFSPGMTWENYGEWHIDHIRPLCDFDLSDRLQFLEACHFTNLQPLWAVENMRKGGYSPP